MNKIIYIGSFSQLLQTTFGTIIREEFIETNLPFIVHDYDALKRHSPEICSKLNYEYVDEEGCMLFVNKWRKIHQKYKQEHSDFENVFKK